MEKHIISRLSFYITLILGLTTNVVSAQRPHLQVGFNLGSYSNSISVATSTIQPSMSFSGVSGDVFVRITKSRFLFRTGVNYQYLYRMKSGSGDWEGITCNYLGLPFQVGGNIINGRYLKWRLFTGLAAQFRVSGNDTFIQSYGESLSELLLPVGIGTGLDLGYFSLDLRYDHIINSYFKNTPAGGFTALNINIGMIF